MPKAKNQRQRSSNASSESSTVSTTTSAHSNALSLKDLMAIIPAFSTPARIWASKIKLLWADSSNTPVNLIDVIKLRLPASLFELVSDYPFTSHISLLDKICSLDEPSSDKASQLLFESKGQVQSDKSPRELFQEMKRLAAITFPDVPQEFIISIAWKKLIAALPISIQQTLALLPNQDFSEQTVETLDKIYKQQGTSSCQAISDKSPATTDVLQSLMKTMDTISSRLDALEFTSRDGSATINAAIRPGTQRKYQPHHFNDEDICWYHRKFGNQAQHCTQPCAFRKSSSVKYNGAPTP